MTKIFLRSIVWNENTIGHIKKHDVRKVEVERAIWTRLISVVVFKESRDRFVIVTARDADKKERRLAYEKEKNKQNSQV